MQDRRDFLRKLGQMTLMGSMAALPIPSFGKKAPIKLTILHTNDTHSRIDPFANDDPKYPGLGGCSARAALIKTIRKEEEHVLLLDAGDVFQGTPYFNMYGGELEFKLMSEMGYDASTIGNHDFDNGVEGLASQLHNAKFPFLCSNYDFSGTPLAEKTIPFKVFNKGGIKVGVFGIGIELKGLVDKRMYGETVYQDPLEKAAAMSHFLKKELKCDLIICLSHLGLKYEGKKVSDDILARQSMNIDLIIGGHTHTFLDTPRRIRNREGNEVLVAQVGWAGIKLGRIDYYFEPGSAKKLAFGSSLKVSNLTSQI